MSYITWNDLYDREDAAYFSEAIELCRSEALTPHQVASLLAGGILRDDIEVEAWDEWSENQVGDWGYEDRYTKYTEDDDDDLDPSYVDVLVAIINKLAEHRERMDDLVEENADLLERIAGLEQEQARRAISHIPVFARVIADV